MTDTRKGKRDEAESETLCRRCGGCCYEKVRFGEQVVITDIPCQYLDCKTRLCTVYLERLEKQPRCASAADSIEAGTLPGDCPYVGGRADYQAPHLLREHPEYRNAVTALFRGGHSAVVL